MCEDISKWEYTALQKAGEVAGKRDIVCVRSNDSNTQYNTHFSFFIASKISARCIINKL